MTQRRNGIAPSVKELKSWFVSIHDPLRSELIMTDPIDPISEMHLKHRVWGDLNPGARALPLSKFCKFVLVSRVSFKKIYSMKFWYISKNLGNS